MLWVSVTPLDCKLAVGTHWVVMMDILPWLGFGAFGVVLIFGLVKGKNKDRGGGFFGMGFETLFIFSGCLISVIFI